MRRVSRLPRHWCRGVCNSPAVFLLFVGLFMGAGVSRPEASGGGSFEIDIYGRNEPTPRIRSLLNQPEIKVRGFVDDIIAVWYALIRGKPRRSSSTSAEAGQSKRKF